MAKFFKNYDLVNLKILEEVECTLSDEEKLEFKREPKHLAMIHTHFCGFCNCIKNDLTYTEEITLLYGYQYCENCKNKKIFDSYLNKWYIDNKTLPFKNLLKNQKIKDNLNSDKEYIIQRSNGKFDDGWMIDIFSLLRYDVTDEEGEDLIIPVYKSSLETRELNKKISLIELFRINNISDELLMIKTFKTELENLKNI